MKVEIDVVATRETDYGRVLELLLPNGHSVDVPTLWAREVGAVPDG
jgi:hypothetical protein